METSSRARSSAGAAVSRLLLALLALGLVLAPPVAAAPAWLAPVDLSAPLRDARDPEVGMDEAGRTVAIWERKDQSNTQFDIYVSTRGLGESFSSPVSIAHPAQDPKLEMTPGGEAVAAWWLGRSGKSVLQFARRPPDGGFASPVDVTEIPQGMSPPEIQLDVNSSGTAALAWLEKNEEGKPVAMVSTIPAGGAPSEPWPVSTGEHEAGSPDVAIDEAGQACVVWIGYSAAEERSGVIQFSRGSGSTFSPSVDVSGADLAVEPQVALQPDGDPTVVWIGYYEEPEPWEDPEKPEYYPPVLEESSWSGSGFEAPEEVSDDPTRAMFSPTLAIGSDGTAVVAWERITPGTTDVVVQAAARDPGGGFSAPKTLSTETNEAHVPDVDVNSVGAAMVVWHGGGTSVIKASLRPPAGAFGTPVSVSAPGNDALFPKVAINHDGDAAAIWSRSNGANGIVQAAGYDANPPEVRNLSLPGTATVGEAVSVSAEPFDVWPLASSSIDFGDGATAPGSSASHAYGAPGTYRVTASASDQAGSSGAAAGEITILASNDFRLGKLKRNKRRGTATLVVEVPGPGGLTLFGKGVRRVAKRARSAGQVKLPVSAAGKAAKRLRRSGKVKLRLRLRFSPDGGPAAEKRRGATLKRVAKKRRHRR